MLIRIHLVEENFQMQQLILTLTIHPPQCLLRPPPQAPTQQHFQNYLPELAAAQEQEAAAEGLGSRNEGGGGG